MWWDICLYWLTAYNTSLYYHIHARIENISLLKMHVHKFAFKNSLRHVNIKSFIPYQTGIRKVEYSQDLPVIDLPHWAWHSAVCGCLYGQVQQKQTWINSSRHTAVHTVLKQVNEQYTRTATNEIQIGHNVLR